MIKKIRSSKIYCEFLYMKMYHYRYIAVWDAALQKLQN